MFLKNKSAQTKLSAHKKEGFPSIITSDVNILGNLVSEGVMDFSGRIDGNIRCQQLTVREAGFVKGEVTADSVFVYGKIHGLIKAKHVHLFSTCHIEGIVMHESITIEDGAFIDGKCKRTDKPQSEGDSAESPVSGQDSATNIKVLENIRLIR